MQDENGPSDMPPDDPELLEELLRAGDSPLDAGRDLLPQSLLPFGDLPGFPSLPEPPPDAATIYAREIPEDNVFGDGVRNPVDHKTVPGLKKRVYVHSEDWNAYNYRGFAYGADPAPDDDLDPGSEFEF
jgi:hypothetical protein